MTVATARDAIAILASLGVETEYGQPAITLRVREGVVAQLCKELNAQPSISILGSRLAYETLSLRVGKVHVFVAAPVRKATQAEVLAWNVKQATVVEP